MRVLYKKKLEEFQLKEDTKQQIFFLQNVKHHNLLNILSWFEDPKNLYLLANLVERQSLASLFKDKKRVEEQVVAKVIFSETNFSTFLEFLKPLTTFFSPRMKLIARI